MTEAQEDISLFDSLAYPDVWLYANIIKGSHAKLKDDENTLAVFKDETIGRSFERHSDKLRSLLGYYATWDEMISIAKKECSGRYKLFTEPDV